MACILLRLALAMPLKSIVALQCDIERLTVLQQANAVLQPSGATACATLDSLLHDSSDCNNSVTLNVGGEELRAYNLYNSTYGSNLLQLASFGMSGECQCPVLSFDGCKARCSDLNELRTINSARRSGILKLHEQRTQLAETARRQQAELLKSAQLILNDYCVEHEESCDFAEKLVSGITTIN